MSSRTLAPATVPAKTASLWTSLRREWALATFCMCVAAAVLLYNLFSSPDVLYDEAAYTWAAQQVALGWHLTLDNQPLFVHPPLTFLLQAGWLRLNGQAAAPLSSAIRVARLLAASVGVADVLLVAALIYQLTSNAAIRRRRILTGVAAVITALDPVLVRYDRQNVIEPFALCISLLALYAAWRLRDRGALVYVSVTGLLSGLALLTNEITIFLLIVPLIFAALEKNRSLIRYSLTALAIAIIFLFMFLLWAAELGLASTFINTQTTTLQRLIGLLQFTGLNMPGVSLTASLARSFMQYSSSYVVLAIGAAALIWCWSRRNTQTGNFLTAWLTASYAFGAYIVAVGTLNEQFFVYLLPASIVSSILFADALLAGCWQRARRPRLQGLSGIHRRRFLQGSPRLPLTIGAICSTGLVSVSATSWLSNYNGAGNGIIMVEQFIANELPKCAAINASGDPQKYSYLADGRTFENFSVGPAALADGVHYFLLAPNDAIEGSADMSPTLENWIQDNGQQLAKFPSQVYKTVQLWYIPASPYAQAVDLVDIPDGVFINTVGSHCGGYTVTNGSTGSFYSEYQALGGKSVVGGPLTQVTRTERDGHEQFFDGVVLAARSTTGLGVRALPIVKMLAEDSPGLYRKATLPPVQLRASATERRSWLTNPAIARAYLGGTVKNPLRYEDAVRRYGEPLGPPSKLPGDRIAQSFANIVLEVPAGGGSPHAVAVTPDVVAARLLDLPSQARDPQTPPALPNASPLGSPEPTSVKPFVLTLGAFLALYGITVGVLSRRQRRRWQASASEPRWDEVAS